MTTAWRGWRSFDERRDAVHVRDVAQCENMRQVRAGNGRHDGLGALAQDEFVVRHIALRCHPAPLTQMVLAARLIERTSWLTCARTRERSQNLLRCHDDQFGAVVNFAGDEIRQAAVGEGNVGAALEDLDFGVFINPAGLGGGGSAACHAPDNHDAAGIFHKSDSALCRATGSRSFGRDSTAFLPAAAPCRKCP